MKANLKGLGGIKGLALRHGEKIVISIVGLLALWFVYSSLSLPSLEDSKQAAELERRIRETNTSITSSTWPAAGSEEAKDIREHKEIAKHAVAAVDAGKYPFHGVDPPVIAKTLLRGDPPVLAAMDLRVHGNSAILSFLDEKTRDEQDRRRRLEEEEKQKKLKAQQPAEGGEAPGARRGGRGEPGEVNAEVFDEEHPNRRLIEGMGTTPAGVPLQGGERLERVSFATIVAKVPIRKQLELFQDTFRNARGYDTARDFPQYVGYQVQRAEVVAGKPTEWKIVYVYDGQQKYMSPTPKPAGKFVNIDTVNVLNQRAQTEWSGPAIEPVDARWTDSVLTLPLPPLVGRNFGADATHPDIPLAINAPPPEEQAVPVEDPAQKPVEGGDDSDFTAGKAGQQAPAGNTFAMQPRPGGPGFGAGPEGGGRMGFGYGQGRGGPESEFMSKGMGAGPEGGAGASYAGGISGQRTVLQSEVDDLLLRFFDYTVEPGKEYQYRVRVFLVDPNSSLPLGVLDGAVVDRRIKEKKDAEAKGPTAVVPWYRAAEWSEPSPIVGIPIGGLVHVAEAELPSDKTANDEPGIKIIAEAFDIEQADGSAIHVAQETELRRGAVVNLKGKMKYTGENDRWIDTKDSYALNTGLTVLDIDGGDTLVKDLVTPSRVLLMDGAGQLSVRQQQDDTQSVQYLRYVFSDKPRRSTEMPGGGFGPEGPGRGRGRGREQ